MPATAAHQPDSDGEPCLASVVSLASRRGAKVSTEPPALNATDRELAEQAHQHWASVFGKAGLELGSAEARTYIPLITRELERLVSGLLVLREGRDSLPADPNAGVDFTSAVEITSVLRDLAHATEMAQTKQG
ncbi:hypothetical protein ACIA7S_28565 [Streptomyces sp. NPDC051643]|uniref:hypothetical protein n=1 Tax=Streptomyces sp. NPDC051643 TaxID=3365665 RepID=UPI00379E3D07